MDPDKLKAALEAMKNGDGEAALMIMEDMIESLAAGAAGDSEGSEESLADDPPDEESEELAAHPDEDEDDKDKDKEMSALARATGHKSDAALAKSYSQLLSRVARLDTDKAQVELGARRELVADLVKLGVETPATAWAGDAEARMPVKRLMSEPISGLRDRVDAMRAVRPALIEAPTAVARSQKALTKAELAGCKRLNITADEFNERKAAAVVRSN